MTRLILSVLFVLALLTHAAPSRAEDAPEAQAEKAESPAANAEEKNAEEKAPEKDEKKAGEKAAEKTDAKPAEDKKAEAAAEEEIPKGIRDHQKAAEEVFQMTKEIAEKLNPEEQKHFFLLYNNYNLIGTVKMVQEDVGNAVKACGEANPDMKEGLDARLTEWNGAVNPVVKDAEGNISNMVAAQEYAKPAQIKKVFKGLDKTRTLANKQIEKTPVTTKDACEYLQEKMADTQKNFIRLLQGTLMSAPQAIPTSEPEQKKVEVEQAKEEAWQEDKPAAESEKKD